MSATLILPTVNTSRFGLRVTAELKLRRIGPFAALVEIQCLTDEHPLPPQVRLYRHLVCLAARKPGDAEGVIEAESLIDFRADPDFRARPQAPPQEQGRIDGFRVGVGLRLFGPA